MSFSRAAWLALLMSAPFILIKAWRRGKFQKKLISLFVILIIGISVAVVIPNRDLFFVRAANSNSLRAEID